MKSLTLDDVAALREERVKQAIADASPLHRPIMQKAYASTGLPRPVRIKGRLAWKVSDLQAFLGA
jgi:predicted DNA-binding transcriptional regulator AlpA